MGSREAPHFFASACQDRRSPVENHQLSAGSGICVLAGCNFGRSLRV